MYAKAQDYLQSVADRLLAEGPVQPMVDAMEDLADAQLKRYAPVEFSNLRESGHPTVVSDGETVYDRAPEQRRLTDDELDEQKRLGVRHRVLHPELYRKPGG